jgi:hypothetical protein
MNELRELLTSFVHAQKTQFLSSGDGLSRHLSRRPDWQPQRPAQGGQVVVPRAAVIRFPKIHTRGTDADQVSDFCGRQSAFNSRVAQVAGKI